MDIEQSPSLRDFIRTTAGTTSPAGRTRTTARRRSRRSPARCCSTRPRWVATCATSRWTPGGYSTLERHEHMHAVMILRGHGHCLLGDAVRAVKPFDLISIPAWTWHQFRATRGEPMGFLCMVNQVRDKPQLTDRGATRGARGRSRRSPPFWRETHDGSDARQQRSPATVTWPRKGAPYDTITSTS